MSHLDLQRNLDTFNDGADEGSAGENYRHCWIEITHDEIDGRTLFFATVTLPDGTVKTITPGASAPRSGFTREAAAQSAARAVVCGLYRSGVMPLRTEPSDSDTALPTNYDGLPY